MLSFVKNPILRIILDLIFAVVGTLIFGLLTVVFYIKFAGFSFIDIGSPGDKSPFTFLIFFICLILTLTFPAMLWLKHRKIYSAEKIGKYPAAITAAVFILFPIVLNVGRHGYFAFQGWLSHYNSVRWMCDVPNGENIKRDAKEVWIYSCKDGVIDGRSIRRRVDGTLAEETNYVYGKKQGVEKLYDEKGNLHLVTQYKDDVEDGSEIYYNARGATTMYVINKMGKGDQIYFQMPEDRITQEISLDSQKFLCTNSAEYNAGFYQYNCRNGLIDGIFSKFDDENLIFRIHLKDGVLDGAYEEYYEGKLRRRLDFADGVLNGKAIQYDEKDNLLYEGTYINGLQEGTFRFRVFDGYPIRTLQFRSGKIVKY